MFGKYKKTGAEPVLLTGRKNLTGLESLRAGHMLRPHHAAPAYAPVLPSSAAARWRTTGRFLLESAARVMEGNTWPEEAPKTSINARKLKQVYDINAERLRQALQLVFDLTSHLHRI
ncbi:hypothetical protein [Pseudomonas sp. G(2018)]|uniref:hypothetical protein n=1 Tax=Pseudomonas sp. G(2018) TaxID=2502242 RepID=UPI001484E0D8|nr:hypothetical protein [Pseudomonas sp. G(2018)]